MALYFFTIPVVGSKQLETELNTIINQNVVVNIDKYFVAAGENSFWSICLTTAQGQVGSTAPASPGKRKSVDYKDVLSADDFAIYAELRKLRKQISDAEGVPAYAVFTNEQLARIVTDKVDSDTDLLAIDGVGKGRVEKYGGRFLTCLRQHGKSGAANSRKT